MDENLKSYRLDLVETEKKLKENYDKLIVTLSGGALALSIAFIKDIVNLETAQSTWLLLMAWAGFILSLAAVLGALSFGIEAHRHAIYQVDDDSIYDTKPGGWFSRFTKALHRASAIFLLLGLISISAFAYTNVGDNNARGTTTIEANTIPTTIEANTK